jgi:hypothetical protein
MAAEIVKYLPVNKPGLLGFLTVRIFKGALEIRDIAHRVTDGREWIAMPSRSYEAKDGTKKYQDYARFVKKEHHEAFCEDLLRAIPEFRRREKTAGATAKADDDIPF